MMRYGIWLVVAYLTESAKWERRTETRPLKAIAPFNADWFDREIQFRVNLDHDAKQVELVLEDHKKYVACDHEQLLVAGATYAIMPETEGHFYKPLFVVQEDFMVGYLPENRKKTAKYWVVENAKDGGYILRSKETGDYLTARAERLVKNNNTPSGEWRYRPILQDDVLVAQSFTLWCPKSGKTEQFLMQITNSNFWLTYDSGLLILTHVPRTPMRFKRKTARFGGLIV